VRWSARGKWEKKGAQRDYDEPPYKSVECFGITLDQARNAKDIDTRIVKRLIDLVSKEK
jgi:hypothetical protein